jgi:putative phage-type endonuclease
MRHKAVKLVSTGNLDHVDWLAWRKKGVGSSDIAAALGENPWRGRLSLWKEKLGLWEPEFSEDVRRRMDLGKAMEPIIAAEFIKDFPEMTFERVNFILQHPRHAWALANLDGVVRQPLQEPEVIEMKNVREASFDSWRGMIPRHYYLQVQHQLFVTGYKTAWFVVMRGGDSIHSWRIARDEEAIEKIEREGAWFWAAVVGKREPTPSAADKGLVEQTHKVANESSVEIPASIISSLRDALKLEDMASGRVEELKTQIKALMGDCVAATVDGEKVCTWGNVRGREVFDQKRFQRDQPEVYKSYISAGSGYRVFKMANNNKGE